MLNGVITNFDLDADGRGIEITAICPHDGLITICRLPFHRALVADDGLVLTCEHCSLEFLVEEQTSEE